MGKDPHRLPVSFMSVELEYPFVDPVLYDIFETPTCINSMIP